MQNWIWFSVRPTWLALALVLIVAAAPLQVEAAPRVASLPAECFTDQGRAIEPRADISDGWALLLSFNHAPSTDVTIGCVATRSGGKQLDYRLIECRLTNNLRQMTVGGGAATFDGNFWIACDGPAWGIALQDTFDVIADAQFYQPGTYTLMEHADATIDADVDIDWHVALTSRYGQTGFTNVDLQTTVHGQLVTLRSKVHEKTGSHLVNGYPLTPPAAVVPFDFDAGASILIGAPGEHWTLSEVIIDPPGGCCRG